MAATPDGGGYWEVAADGGIFAFGDAPFFGSMGGQHLNSPVVGISSSTDGSGYRMVASDGGIFAFGDAPFAGSMGRVAASTRRWWAPPTTPTPAGYWEVAADGGVFSFGGAPFSAPPGGSPLNAPIVGMAETSDGSGYRLAGRRRRRLQFGSAAYEGSMGGGRSGVRSWGSPDSDRRRPAPHARSMVRVITDWSGRGATPATG